MILLTGRNKFVNFANQKRSMKIFIKNIKQLVQVEGKPKLLVKGKEMSELNTIKDSWLLLEDEKISSFGKMNKINESQIQLMLEDAKVIDASEKMVFPSFCDSHTHLVYPQSREIEYRDKIRGFGKKKFGEDK